MNKSNEILIHVADLHKVFVTEEVETHALSGVHLKIQKGEYIAIAGPSGCGKSTLLSIWGFLIHPQKATTSSMTAPLLIYPHRKGRVFVTGKLVLSFRALT